MDGRTDGRTHNNNQTVLPLNATNSPPRVKCWYIVFVFSLLRPLSITQATTFTITQTRHKFWTLHRNQASLLPLPKIHRWTQHPMDNLIPHQGQLPSIRDPGDQSCPPIQPPAEGTVRTTTLPTMGSWSSSRDRTIHHRNPSWGIRCCKVKPAVPRPQCILRAHPKM